ncbi:MAG: MoaD/ThiS family protein [Theionarchaea archaeon]|nr:MoaD/ThiS family protein [Theionarchaea archaeon]
MKYFGVLKQKTGKQEEYVEGDITTVDDVKRFLEDTYGLNVGVLVAINRRMVFATETLSEHDEVAVFPPVVGG